MDWYIILYKKRAQIRIARFMIKMYCADSLQQKKMQMAREPVT